MIRWIVKRVIDAIEAEGLRVRPFVIDGSKLTVIDASGSAATKSFRAPKRADGEEAP